MYILITLLSVLSTSADTVTIVDVIRSVPTDNNSTWIVGDHEIKQDSSTKFGSELAVKGNLAKVNFVDEDGVKVAS